MRKLSNIILTLCVVLIFVLTLLTLAQSIIPVQAEQPAPTKVQQPEHSPVRDTSHVQGEPSISAAFINQLLCKFKSPVCGSGQALYDLGISYGIDPAYALAFFMHESTFGTQGVARDTLSLGNLRCVKEALSCASGYSHFATWDDGFRAWYKLIADLYIKEWKLNTVELIVPVYAPAADHNVPDHYIAVVKAAVQLWRTGIVALP